MITNEARKQENDLKNLWIMISEYNFNKGDKYKNSNYRIYLDNKTYIVQILQGTKVIKVYTFESYYNMKEFINKI